jgi:hypothetical protein
MVTNAAHYGVARMMSALAEIEGRQTGVFRTTEAVAWLRTPPTGRE